MKNVNRLHSGKCILEFVNIFTRRITKNYVYEVPAIG